MDTVVRLMARAEMAAGFRHPATVRLADTARVSAGPQILDAGPPNIAFVVSAEMSPLGDSVRVRFEAGWASPKQGWAGPADSLAARSEALALCDTLALATR